MQATDTLKFFVHIFQDILNHVTLYYPGGCSFMGGFYIPIGTPSNISCSLQGSVITAATTKFKNNTLVYTEVPIEPVELIPGIVATCDSPLTSLLLTVNTSNTEVVGLGCAGVSDMKNYNVTLFGEQPVQLFNFLH